MIFLSFVMLAGLWYTLLKDIRDPIILFLLPWVANFIFIYSNSSWLVLHDQSMFVIYFMIIIIIYGNLIFSAKFKPLGKIDVRYREVSIIKIVALGLIISYFLVIYDAFSYSRGIIAFALESRQAQMTDANWPGLLGNAIVFRVIKNTMSFGFPVIAILLVLHSQKLATLTAILLSLSFLVTGERWGAFVAVLMLMYNKLLLTDKPLRLSTIAATIFVFIFSLGSILRDRMSTLTILNDILVYSSGGVVAFSHMLSGECNNCYTPPTFRYIASFLGLTEKSTNIVGDKVYLNSSGDWTNTFSMFGSLYFYFGLAFTFIIILLYLLLLKLLYLKKHKPVPRMYLIMLVPAAPLSVFSDAFLSSAPYLVRGLLLTLFLIRFRWNFRL